MSIAETLAQATANLIAYNVPNPRLDVEVLLAYALGLTRARLYARLRDSLSEANIARYHQLIKRRQQREPLQYITGVQEFWSLEFRVTPDVLIPRPETELVVETSLRLLSQHETRSTRHDKVRREEESQKSKVKEQKSKVQNPTPGSRLLAPTIRNPQSAIRILDIGTGSGCIAIALAKELPDAELWAIDISSAALAIAQENAQRHGVAERIHFLSGDLFAPLRDLTLDFFLIVSNPPYIPQPDLLSLQPEVQDWEPHRALDGGKDGLDAYRRLLQESPRYLQADGWLAMEIGQDQGQAVLRLVQQQPELTNSTCLLDYEGRKRVVLTQKKPEHFAQR